jgi:hypothetical protein
VLVTAHIASWWAALTVLGIALAVLIYRLLAERGRRKTLEVTFRAPANTVVILGKGPSGPSTWIWVGERQREEQPGQVVWVCHQSAAQVRHRRRA